MNQFMPAPWPPRDETPQFFRPLAAWVWNKKVYTSDEDGFAQHRLACDIIQGYDRCSCQADRVNELIRETGGEIWHPSEWALEEANRLMDALDVPGESSATD